MDFAQITLYPLADVTEIEFQRLCETLWKVCAGCAVRQRCIQEDCVWRRRARLEPFFQYYKEITQSYVSDIIPDESQAIRSHQDLADIIRLIKEKPNQHRIGLTEEYFKSRGGNEPPLSDQHRAFNLAVRVFAMVNCAIETQPGGLLESGVEPSLWRSNKSLADFFSTTFRIRDHPSLNDIDETFPDIKLEVTAKQLRKVAGLKFKGTDNLHNHLKLDHKNGIVEFYHHTSVLKENLMASKEAVHELSGNIPRQLALETLDSLQKFLFPLDPESQALLRSLISKQSLDPDCLRFGSSSYRRDNENNATYQYWGSRLMDLYEEIENPKPRSFVDKWLEQRSKARHVMFATLAGVIIAILLGLLGLAVSIFQAWVSYKAWKYPVTSISQGVGG